MHLAARLLAPSLARPFLAAAAALALGAAPGLAQFSVNGTVGPNPCPVGCDVQITISVDYQGLGSSIPCPFRVLDTGGAVVYTPGCTPSAVLIGPGGWLTATWDQTDDQGAQVPPGEYVVEVSFDVGPPKEYPILIAGDGAALVQQGTPRIGTNRPFYLCSPQDAGQLYFLLGALSDSPGLPTCNGTLPLAVDTIFVIALTPNTLFQASLGFLGPDGTTTAPSFAVPNDPSLIGLSLESAFFTFDLEQACPVLHVSPAYELAIV